MYYKTNIPVENEVEFLASEKVVAFTGTVSDEVLRPQVGA